MGDVLQFTNPKWLRLTPLYLQPCEIRCVVIYNWLELEVPRPVTLSVFENKWLDRISGYRNREVYDFVKDTRSLYDARVTMELYGTTGLPENVRWKKGACQAGESVSHK
jgi:hypothetical protein